MTCVLGHSGSRSVVETTYFGIVLICGRSTGRRSVSARPARSRPGLIFGYATLAEPTIHTGIAVLADAIRAL
jgi:hypothetical protein